MKSFPSRARARKTITTTSILLLSAYSLYRFLSCNEKDTREKISYLRQPGCKCDDFTLACRDAGVFRYGGLVHDFNCPLAQSLVA